MGNPQYRKLFDPDLPTKSPATKIDSVADRASPETFLFDDAVVLAINVALATRRPLLLRGPSGVGKSSVARAVAWRQGWSYLQITVTSRTMARDFLYQIDDLRRLQDAYRGDPTDDMRRYLTPGPLLWAFAPDYARSILSETHRLAMAPAGIVPGASGTVLLIDEIDKADPDVPNNLLEPLGSFQFQASELTEPIVAAADRVPLIVLTTNEERDLPDAFLRRCIEHRIEPPSPDRLREIAASHFKKPVPVHHDIAIALSPRSPAEYLDAIRACRELAAKPATEADLKAIAQVVLGPGAKGE